MCFHLFARFHFCRRDLMFTPASIPSHGRLSVCACVVLRGRVCVCVYASDAVAHKHQVRALRSYRAAFRLRVLVHAPRVCAPSTLLRRSHHPTDLMPTLSRSASAPLARDSGLVSLSSCPPPPSPPPVCARRAHTTLLFLYSLFFINFSSGALQRHASNSTHSPKRQWHSLP